MSCSQLQPLLQTAHLCRNRLKMSTSPSTTKRSLQTYSESERLASHLANGRHNNFLFLLDANDHECLLQAVSAASTMASSSHHLCRQRITDLCSRLPSYGLCPGNKFCVCCRSSNTKFLVVRQNCQTSMQVLLFSCHKLSTMVFTLVFTLVTNSKVQINL